MNIRIENKLILAKQLFSYIIPEIK